MAPVETEYYDLVWQTTAPHDTRDIRVEFLTCSFTNAQLGVSVDFQETDLKKAYRKAAMKVLDLASSNLNRLTRRLLPLLWRFPVVVYSIIRIRTRHPKRRKSLRR